MNIVILLAGGVGSRMGANIPKQYLKVKDKPIIVYTMEKLQRSEDVDAIEVVCNKEYVEYVKELVAEYNITKVRWVNVGGSTCQDSIRNGIYAIREDVSDDDVFFTHMSVSPMISYQTIKTAFDTCREKGNAFAVQPLLFCMGKKVCEDGKLIEEWTDQNAYKEEFIAINMPWTMRYGDAYAMYKDADENNRGTAKNDYLLSLLFASGKKAYLFPDNDANRLKITTKGDLDLFEAYLTLEEMRGREIDC